MKKLLLFLGLGLTAFAGQSLRLNGSQTALNSTVAAQGANAACRMEFQITWTSSPTNGVPAAPSACGWNFSFANSGASLRIYSNRANAGCCNDISLALFTSNWAIVRMQIVPSGAGGVILWDAWDINGVLKYTHSTSYTSTSGSNSNGITLSSTGSQDTSWGFFRLYTSNVALGSKEPQFSDTGNLLEWRFNNSLLDEGSDGHNYTAVPTPAGTPPTCGSTPCYVDSTGQTLVSMTIMPDLVASFPARLLPCQTTNPTQSCKSWDINGNFPAYLDASQSVQQSDTPGSPTCSWTLNSGPSTPTLTTVGGNACVKSVTNAELLFGDYNYTVTGTAGAGMGTATMDIGAVPLNANGVLVPANSNVTNIFGPMIGFGYNPWGWEDERTLAALNIRWAIYNTPETYTSYTLANPSWDNPQTGTIIWRWNGVGWTNNAGNEGTTLTGGISTSSTQLSVANASVLDLTSFPTRITIRLNTTSEPAEEIRVCSTVSGGTTGAQTFNVCYDGRGIAPASGLPSGSGDVLGATSWLTGAVVGQQLQKGSGTSFLTTIAPAGAGPAGPIQYSTGTVGLTAGSTTLTGTGTAWNTTITPIGYAVRVSGTTHSGTGFTFISFISSVGGTGSITLNHAFPSDADTASGLSYAIIRPWYRFLVPHFTRPSPYAGDALTEVGTTGCESDTQCFSNLYVHYDVSGVSGTQYSAVQYSFRDNNSAYVSNGPIGSFTYYAENLAWRALEYRSGLTLAKTAADVVDNHFPRYPSWSGGPASGSARNWGGGIWGALAGHLLDGTSTNNDIHPVLNKTGAATYQCYNSDSRDDGYDKLLLVGGARYSDTDAYPGGGTWLSHYQSFMSALNTTEDGCATPAGGSGVAINSVASAGTRWGTSSGNVLITLTNGSAIGTGTAIPTSQCDGLGVGTLTATAGSATVNAVTGTFGATTNDVVIDGRLFGATYVNSTQLTLATLWPGSTATFGFLARHYTSGSLVAYGTSVTDPTLGDNYSCVRDSSTQITLDRPFNSRGDTTPAVYQQHNDVLSGIGQQPFMLAIRQNAYIQGAALDASLMTTFGTKNVNTGTWLQAYGIDPLTLASYYGRVFGFTSHSGCESGGTAIVSPAVVWVTPNCQSGYEINNMVAQRQLNQDVTPGIIQWYLANPTLANRTLVDSYYGAVWCNSTMNDSSIASTCDQYAVGNNAGLSNLTNAGLAGGKYPGQMFGMGRAHEWPAVRLSVGSVVPTITTTCPLSAGIRGAAYTQTLTATGDNPITWSISSGTLPTGLSLVGAVISGTPSVSGVATFGIQAVNASGNSTNGPLSCNITINDPPSTGGSASGGLGVFGGIQQSK